MKATPQQTVIRIRRLGKRYRIGAAFNSERTTTEAMMQQAGGLLRRLAGKSNTRQDNTFWALRDINLNIHRGEVVGIIGHNGAGKSTLLKLLSRITEPTTGTIAMRGKVGSLLEVGTGFHPELTGRENIYLNGSILGMSRREIKSKFNQIVTFADIEKFLDTPVKRYSSGMYVRLAFAVAAHLEPQILIVDEVLAVGDAGFQARCLGKMRDIADGSGRTVLFVSHNMAAIRGLCDRAVLLADGRITTQGPADVVVQQYLEQQSVGASTSGCRTWTLDDAPGDDLLHIESLQTCDEQGRVGRRYTPQQMIDVQVAYRLHKPVEAMRIVLQLRTAYGEIALTSTDDNRRDTRHLQPGRYLSRCRIPGRLLNVHTYTLRAWAGIPGQRVIADTGDCLKLDIAGVAAHNSRYVESALPGVVAPELDWQIQPCRDQGDGLAHAA